MEILGAQTVQFNPGQLGTLRVFALATPALTAVVPTGGAAGAYSYYVVALDALGNRTLPSATTVIANGPTALDGTHFNTLTWAAVAGAAGYDVVRSAGGPSQGRIAANVNALSFTDTGQAATGYPAPTVNATGGVGADGAVSGNNLVAQTLTVTTGAATLTLGNPVTLGGRIDRAGSATYATMSTSADTTIYSLLIKANMLGMLGAVRVTIFGDLLCNSGAPTFTFTIKYGATVLWSDTCAAYGAAATRAPWWLAFILAADGGAPQQVLGGQITMDTLVAATAGEGDLGAASRVVAAIFGTAGENSATDLTLAVTVRPSVSNVNVALSVRFAYAEYLPA